MYQNPYFPSAHKKLVLEAFTQVCKDCSILISSILLTNCMYNNGHKIKSRLTMKELLNSQLFQWFLWWKYEFMVIKLKLRQMKFIPRSFFFANMWFGFYKLGVWIMSELVQAHHVPAHMWYCILALCKNKEYIQWRNLDLRYRLLARYVVNMYRLMVTPWRNIKAHKAVYIPLCLNYVNSK